MKEIIYFCQKISSQSWQKNKFAKLTKNKSTLFAKKYIRKVSLQDWQENKLQRIAKKSSQSWQKISLKTNKK